MGANDGLTTAEEATVLDILGRFCMLDEVDFGAAAVATDEALEDRRSCAVPSTEVPTWGEVGGFWAPSGKADSKVEAVAVLLVRGSEVAGLLMAKDPEVLPLVFLEAASTLLTSSKESSGDFTPTASFNLLYSPLKPCCTRSPAPPFLSEVGEELGGAAKSLKVVKTSDWLAEVWI